MANNLYNALSGGTNNNMAQFVQRFEQFRRAFSGDPEQTVKQLLNSGRMTQEQYNQLSQAATQIQKMLPKI